MNEKLRISDKHPTQLWEGSGSSSKPFNQEWDPISVGLNYSNNKLNIRARWNKFKGKSPNYCLRHRNDIIENTGFAYQDVILKKSLSSVLYLEKKRELILNLMDWIFFNIVETVKDIKKSYNWNFEKEYNDFN